MPIRGPLKITIEGPQGSGKTLLGMRIALWCYEQGLSTCSRDDTPRSAQYDELLKSDILIIEKQTQ